MSGISAADARDVIHAQMMRGAIRYFIKLLKFRGT
jgi:response regulator of citrate/malate metabolism